MSVAVKTMHSNIVLSDIDISDWVYMTDHAYTEKEVRMCEIEIEMLEILPSVWRGWGAFHFVAHYFSALGLSRRHLHAATMCLQLALYRYAFSRHTPGLQAAGACLCAAHLMEKSGFENWDGSGGMDQVLSAMSGRDVRRLQRIALEIHRSIQELSKSSLQAVRKYYSREAYSNVAALVYGDA